MNTVVSSVIPKDDRNNVERVDIPSSVAARTFKVKITPQGTITGTTQKVSLVINGATRRLQQISASLPPTIRPMLRKWD